MKTLYKYQTTARDGSPTWGLMPTTKDSRIIDATWYESEQALLVLLEDKKETFINRPDPASKSGRTREVKFETYYEHLMTDKKEIEEFLKTFVINYDGKSPFKEPKKVKATETAGEVPA